MVFISFFAPALPGLFLALLFAYIECEMERTGMKLGEKYVSVNSLTLIVLITSLVTANAAYFTAKLADPEYIGTAIIASVIAMRILEGPAKLFARYLLKRKYGAGSV